jgi:methylated-DNA-[protein]-cysteine S-methyltransferase
MMRADIVVTLWYRTIDSPIGPLLLAGDEGALRYLLFANGRQRMAPRPEWQPDAGALDEVVAQLTAYFGGRRRAFDIPVVPEGTPFQLAVWEQLRRIPYGETISYAELARRIGNPKAVRAVGLANGANPISIVIPCHRVIGSTGALVGYGGGLRTKQALLALESGQARLL